MLPVSRLNTTVMKALFEFALAGANIIPSLLLAFIILYWLTVLIGAIDLDMFDIDVDVDADADIELDGHPEGGLEWMNSILRFFNLGRVPLMVFLTFLVLPLWLFCIIVNDFLGFESMLPGLLTLAVGFFISLFIAKILTLPFVKLFDKLEKETSYSVIGKICTLQSTVQDERLGQARIVREEGGAPIVLTVKTKAGTVVSPGETALVLEYQPQHRCYLVEPYTL